MELVSVSIIQDNLCFEHTKYVTMGIVLVFLNLSHNWILTVNRHLSLGLNRHGLLIRPCLKTLVFLHLKQKTVQRKKDVEILNKLHCKTLSLKQLIKKPPKKFCKQKISDCIEERITLTNDYILPMKRSMCYLVLTWFEVSHEVMLKRKNLTTCCNQNMPALPLSDDLYCWTTRTFSYNYFMQRIRVLLSANEPILHRLVSHCYNSLLTFSVMLSRWKWGFLEPQKVKMSKAIKLKKGPAVLLY